MIEHLGGKREAIGHVAPLCRAAGYGSDYLRLGTSRAHTFLATYWQISSRSVSAGPWSICWPDLTKGHWAWPDARRSCSCYALALVFSSLLSSPFANRVCLEATGGKASYWRAMGYGLVESREQGGRGRALDWDWGVGCGCVYHSTWGSRTRHTPLRDWHS
jgi:hypothetical protein